MSLKQYLILMTVGTVLCWVAWGFVLLNVNPFTTDWSGLAFFYVSLFLAVVGTFSVAGFMVRRAIIKNDTAVLRHVRHTFRQSVILSSLIVGALLLATQQLLNWWIGLLLIFIFIGLEGVLFTTRKFTNIQ